MKSSASSNSTSRSCSTTATTATTPSTVAGPAHFSFTIVSSRQRQQDGSALISTSSHSGKLNFTGTVNANVFSPLSAPVVEAPTPMLINAKRKSTKIAPKRRGRETSEVSSSSSSTCTSSRSQSNRDSDDDEDDDLQIVDTMQHEQDKQREQQKVTALNVFVRCQQLERPATTTTTTRGGSGGGWTEHRRKMERGGHVMVPFAVKPPEPIRAVVVCFFCARRVDANRESLYKTWLHCAVCNKSLCNACVRDVVADPRYCCASS